MNRSKQLPIDKNNKPMQLVPNTTALATTVDSSISAATDVSLNADTTFIEVNALVQGVYLKYGATASSSDFDEFIQAGMVRHYVIPDGVTTISVIEASASATVVIIEK
jgi:hypothetical protein